MTTVKENSLTISNLYKSRKILLELLESRGYDIDEWNDFSINEVQAMHTNDQLDLLLTHKTSSKKIYVKYHIHKKLNYGNVGNYVEDIFINEEILQKDDELIVFTKHKPNDTLIKFMKMLFVNDRQFVNIYFMKQYLFNILNHVSVPQHKVLTDTEKKQIYDKYNVTRDSEMPEINRFDPVAQAIGLRPGQVCEITRSSPTSITSKYYRFCLQ
jgi:DNA-directed RNA polymerase subunit H (RpoH/RPB5)